MACPQGVYSLTKEVKIKATRIGGGKGFILFPHLLGVGGLPGWDDRGRQTLF